jgi:hypothetical protein
MIPLAMEMADVLLDRVGPACLPRRRSSYLGTPFASFSRTSPGERSDSAIAAAPSALNEASVSVALWPRGVPSATPPTIPRRYSDLTESRDGMFHSPYGSMIAAYGRACDPRSTSIARKLSRLAWPWRAKRMSCAQSLMAAGLRRRLRLGRRAAGHSFQEIATGPTQDTRTAAPGGTVALHCLRLRYDQQLHNQRQPALSLLRL